MTQSMKALSRANEIRIARAQLKRELAAGEQDIGELVLDPPESCQTAKPAELLRAVPMLGPRKADRILVRARIRHSRTLGELVEPERVRLYDAILQITGSSG